MVLCNVITYSCYKNYARLRIYVVLTEHNRSNRITMNVKELPAELQQKAERELNEDASKVQHGLRALRDWLSFQKHLKYRDDDQFLLGFLRGCKFRIEDTKKKLDLYYTSRTLSPEFFENRNPFSTNTQTILRNNMSLFYSPMVTFPTLFYGRWSELEKHSIAFENYLKHYFMGVDLIMNENQRIFINGIILLIDVKDTSVQYLMQLNIPVLKKCFYIMQKTLPVLLKGIYVINAPLYIHTLYKLLEVVFSEKLKKRIHILDKNDQKLTDFIPEQYLLTHLGGTAGSLDELGGERQRVWKKKVESYSDWFQEDQRYKSIEEFRVGQPKTHLDLFGQEGSFRQLHFD